jgi:crotonobetainyl-CoA:carnitine CoA-transferase CaiB-like acyl-CoA transferase
VGQRVEVDLYSTAIAMQCQEISTFVNQGADYSRSRSGIGQAWLSAPFGIYQVSDGWIAVAMAPLDVVAKVVDDPAIARLDAWTERDDAKDAIQAVLLADTADAWVARLLEAGVWAARVRSTREAVDELRELGSDLLVTVDGPDGEPIELIGCPIRLSETPWQQRLAPPRVGEHTREILAAVLDEDEIDALDERSRVIAR